MSLYDVFSAVLLRAQRIILADNGKSGNLPEIIKK